MITDENTMDIQDPYHLSRFVEAQKTIYDSVLNELRNGEKRTHWMWYIFPQIIGLGKSSTSIFYSIKCIEEARQYLNHPILGPRLVECAEMVYSIKGRSCVKGSEDR